MSIVFKPEVWSNQLAAQMRSNHAAADWLRVAAETDADAAKRVEEYREREAQRQLNLQAMEDRLKTFPDMLLPIIRLHFRERDQCMGCDVDGYECEQPEWPCRTIETILEATRE